MTFGFHGGEGNFHLWRPGLFPNIDLTINEGIFVAPHDTLYFQSGGSVTEQTTGWFGYWPGMDPFNIVPNTNPPADAVVSDYTQRKVNWIRQWLLRGGDLNYNIDPNRISLMGHSMGGRGISIFARRNPERYSACHMFTPAFRDVFPTNPLYGVEALNLPTNVIGPGGATMHMNDIFDWTQPLSRSQRDLCLTRIYSGKSDAVIGWNSTIVGEFTEANDSAMGFHLFWDSRPHGISNWSQSPYFAEWIVPVRTDRGSARSAQRYRSNQSFPGFYNDDQNITSAGRQPDPGNGTPANGDAWGTWSGYYDWDSASIVDSQKTWSCTRWLVGNSLTSVDNCPSLAARVSIAVRKPQMFKLSAIYPFRWTLKRVDTGAVLSSGIGFTDENGVVKVQNLLIAREDVFKSRLEIDRLPIPKPL
jgi:pimeloyl-ACP methyl ester carboxylesterase